MKALQGTWHVRTLEVDGQKTALDAFSGSQIILKGKTFKTVSMGSAYEGTFTVDTTRTPHTIDITFNEGPHAGQQSLGIFTLTGKTWTLCLGMAGLGRPKKFATTPGSGHALETLSRDAPRPSTRKTAKRAEVGKTGAPSRAQSDTSSEHAGEWSMVSIHQSGKPTVPPEWAHFGLRVVRGNLVTITMNGQVMLKATFTDDSSTTPRSIDYTLAAGPQKGKKQLGVYEVDGDTARYCMAAPGKPRPTALVTRAGDGRTLSVWTRRR
jgi:uncharacterized protein (TIGR03067 family)